MSLSHSLASGYVIGMWDDEGGLTIMDDDAWPILADAQAQLDLEAMWTDETTSTARDRGGVIFAVVPLELFEADR